MENKAVNEIIDIEAKAAEIIKNAEQKSEIITEDCKKQCKDILSQAVKTAKDEAEDMLNKAQKSGQIKATVILSEYDSQIEKLKQDANKNSEDAIKAVISTIMQI